jgi:hypothetical protein
MRNAIPIVAAMLAVAAVLFVSGCTTVPGNGADAITTFEECAAAGYPVMESYPRQCRTPGPPGQTFVEVIDEDDGNGTGPIGGQRDEHGCLGPAGYTWNETIGACVRPWEIKIGMGEAARIAVDYLGQGYATTVTDVAGSECIGCFTVTIEQGEDRERTQVTMKNWIVTDSIVTYHQCTEEEKAQVACTMEYLPVCGHMDAGPEQTYGNKCGACSAGADYWVSGEC